MIPWGINLPFALVNWLSLSQGHLFNSHIWPWNGLQIQCFGAGDEANIGSSTSPALSTHNMAPTHTPTYMLSVPVTKI